MSKKGNAKECSNYHTIVLISHSSKVKFKILQARLRQNVNQELPNVQVGFRKGRGNRDQIANICWIIEKAREFQENIYFLLHWLCESLWLCGSPQTVENSEKDGTTRPASWLTSMQIKKQQSEPEIVEWTGSKLGKEYVKAICHPAYLTYMQSTSCEILGWMKHKLESI